MDTGIWKVYEAIPENAFGFIYEITNTINGKKYIGKKQMTRKIKRKPLKGKKRKRIDYIESDWKTYYGSHSFIKEANNEDLERKILQVAFNKKELTYLECKWQFVLEVLETNKYLNDNILGKFYDRDFR